MFKNYEENGSALLSDNARGIRAKFQLEPSHMTIANTLLRVVQSSVKTAGFRTEPAEESEVIIIDNTTPLPNEMLAHRIGMIPICVADLENFDPSRYEFRLEVENTTQENRKVTTNDIRIYETDDSPGAAGWREIDASSYFPVDPITKDPILITYLRPQWNLDNVERIKLRARASISCGMENIRWSPVSQVSFSNTLDTDSTRQEQFFVEWLNTSKKIADPAGLTSPHLNNLRREWETMEKQRCYLVNDEGEPYSFDFEVESIGVQSVPQIIHTAIREARKIVQKYESLDLQTPSGVHIQPSLAQRRGVEITFENEDHTLGNLLQTFLVERHVVGDSAPHITYAGYRIKHPLKKEMTLEIGAEVDPIELSTIARKAIVETVRFLIGTFDALERDWVGLTGYNTQGPVLSAPVAPVLSEPVARKTSRRAVISV